MCVFLSSFSCKTSLKLNALLAVPLPLSPTRGRSEAEIRQLLFGTHICAPKTKIIHFEMYLFKIYFALKRQQTSKINKKQNIFVFKCSELLMRAQTSVRLWFPSPHCCGLHNHFKCLCHVLLLLFDRNASTTQSR